MGVYTHSKRTVLTRVLGDHVLDWVVIVLLGGVVAVSSNDIWCPPFHRYFLPKNGTQFDPSLNYPNVESSVDTLALVIVSIGFPFGAAVLVQIVNLRIKDEWDWKLDIHSFALAFMESLVVSQMLTYALKKFAGRQRPDFYALLDGGDTAEINSGMKSYPSGHSSLVFTGMTFMALYLCGKLKLVGSRNAFAQFAVVGFVPIMVAALVAASRTRDYKHNFSDINAGAWIGFVSSLSCYSLNFRPLSHEKADIPYSYLDHEFHEHMGTHEHLDPLNTSSREIDSP